MALDFLNDLWALVTGPLRPIVVLFLAVFGAISLTQATLIALGLSRTLPVERQQLIVTIVVGVSIFAILTWQRLGGGFALAPPWSPLAPRLTLSQFALPWLRREALSAPSDSGADAPSASQEGAPKAKARRARKAE